MLQAEDTREAIVRSAMAFVIDGVWDSTSLQSVRQRAGVSNGSLFHHFHSRQDLAAAVVGDALQEHQQVLLAELGGDPESGVTGAVREHLRWVDEHRQVARLLLSAPPGLLRLSLAGPALESNRRFFTEIDRWLREHGWRGRVPLSVVLSLWIGPAQEFSRQRLSWDDDLVSTAADDLASGAWAALRPLLHDMSTAPHRPQS